MNVLNRINKSTYNNIVAKNVTVQQNKQRLTTNGGPKNKTNSTAVILPPINSNYNSFHAPLFSKTWVRETTS